MPISDIFNKLKTSVLGTKTLDVDTQLDNAVKNILSLKADSNQLGYVELIKNLAAKQNGVDKFDLFAPGMSPSTFGQGERIGRYKIYESIVNNITYCKKAVKVLTDNILSPDDITKRSIDIKATQELDSTKEKVSAFATSVKEILKSLKLEQNLDIIVKDTLKYGDFFVEVSDSKAALTSRAYITEAYADYMTNKLLGEHTISVNDDTTCKIRLFDWYVNEDKKEDDDGKGVDVSNLYILLHKPNYIVKLQSTLFSVCFGYLVFPQYDSILQNAGVSTNTVDNLCNQILQNLAKNIPDTEEFQNSKDLKDVIGDILRKVNDRTILNVRFVPPNRMVHFKIPSTKYFPYGESILDPVQFACKLFISLQTALAIQRISRSTEKRLVAVEIGLPRDAKKLVERLKDEFRKRKISIGTYGELDTLASSIATFEDIYVPMKDGKRFIEIDTNTGGNVDTRSKSDELKLIRDTIVAALDVPPPFLNIEENLSNKASLSEENILFARAIISYQRYLGNDLRQLVKIILNLVKPEETLELFNELEIGFPAPKNLQYERQARYLNDITGMIQSLEQVGVPKDYSKKKFLSDIDWDDVENYEVNKEIETITDKEKDEEAGGMVGGGFGGAGGY